MLYALKIWLCMIIAGNGRSFFYWDKMLLDVMSKVTLLPEFHKTV